MNAVSGPTTPPCEGGWLLDRVLKHERGLLALQAANHQVKPPRAAVLGCGRRAAAQQAVVLLEAQLRVLVRHAHVRVLLLGAAAQQVEAVLARR